MLIFAHTDQRGASMIEVLITIVVLAIGLLGLAGLQVTSIQTNHSSYYRSQASILAYDLSDRMRSNRAAALGGAYDVDFPTSSDSHSVTGARAAKDKAEWLNALAAVLPGGTGKVERVDNLLVIHVRWDDTRGQIKTADSTDTYTETFIYRTEI